MKESKDAFLQRISYTAYLEQVHKYVYTFTDFFPQEDGTWVCLT